MWAYFLSWRITGVCLCKAVAHIPKQFQIIWKSASPQWVQSRKSLISASARLVLLQDFCRRRRSMRACAHLRCAARELSIFSCDAFPGMCIARGNSSRYCQHRLENQVLVTDCKLWVFFAREDFASLYNPGIFRCSSNGNFPHTFVFLPEVQQILQEWSPEKTIAIRKGFLFKRLGS